MPAGQFFRDGPRDRVKIELALFLRQARLKHDLEQQITEFFLQLPHIALADRIRHLIGFFDGMGCDAGKILFQVPRTAGFRVPEAGHYFE